MGGRAGDSSSQQIPNIDQGSALRRVFSEHLLAVQISDEVLWEPHRDKPNIEKAESLGRRCLSSCSTPPPPPVCAPCGILAVRPDWSLVFRLALMSTARKLEPPE